MNLGRLRVSITGDATSVLTALHRTDSAMEQSASRAKSSGRRISGSMAVAGRGALGATALLGGAAVGLGGLLATVGVKQAASAEQAKIAFTTITGSAEKADAMLKDLQGFASSTPFEFPELRDSASRLMAVGTHAKDVIPIMSALGDSTSAMGTGSEGINRAVTALTQMRQKGKVTGEEMLQLAEAGVPAWDALASSMGLSVAETQKLVSGGKVKVDQLYSAIENRSGKAMAKVSGMMEAQSGTLTGMFSTLKDTVTTSLGTAAEPLAAELKKQLPAVTAALGPLIAGLGPVFTTIGTAIGPIAALLTPVAQALGEVAAAVGPVISALAAQLAPILASLVPVIAQVVGQLGGTLVTVVELLGPLLGTLVTALAPLLPLLATVIGVLVSALAPIIGAIVPVLVDLVTVIIDALIPYVAEMAPMFAELGGMLGEFLAALLPTIPALMQIVGAVLLVMPIMMRMQMTVFRPLIGLLTLIAGWLSTVVQWLADLLVPALKSGAAAITKNMAPAMDALIGWFSDLWDKVKGGVAWVTGTFTTIVDTVKGIPGRIRSAASGMWDGITSSFRSVLQWIADAWNRLEFSIPSFTFMGIETPGFTLGVPDISIPALAAGGIVTRPTVALIGEAGSEAVVPLSAAGRKLAGLGSTYNLTINVAGGVDSAAVRREARAAGKELFSQLSTLTSTR